MRNDLFPNDRFRDCLTLKHFQTQVTNVFHTGIDESHGLKKD